MDDPMLTMLFALADTSGFKPRGLPVDEATVLRWTTFRVRPLCGFVRSTCGIVGSRFSET